MGGSSRRERSKEREPRRDDRERDRDRCGALLMPLLQLLLLLDEDRYWDR